MYRLVVLPVANTWMSWSLLNKLGITPGAAVVAGIGGLVLLFLLLGLQVRLWRGPGQGWRERQGAGAGTAEGMMVCGAGDEQSMEGQWSRFSGTHCLVLQLTDKT